ncbi:MAG: hypothetical protein A3D44_00670 [Candidatus Staskawiczbacteria bacterium RIFCSPHIGHO2_02_FULL_42_22]|uniref:Uncharacterized protein n=1 Tax=Candidatus Staskawiczbacteria bacterium RIFCSPHIGHO2_02_FULL_42_22 TaxID=1802207 RepID=A0A1G2I1W6_9BACT|nr:MAG: hypothetical protein A3D44_00670 [Candidatus Staskawiczbacteria bacterium RIFCSPHIGHO2_02_FULL_42_22]
MGFVFSGVYPRGHTGRHRPLVEVTVSGQGNWPHKRFWESTYMKISPAMANSSLPHFRGIFRKIFPKWENPSG